LGVVVPLGFIFFLFFIIRRRRRREEESSNRSNNSMVTPVMPGGTPAVPASAASQI
jgi:hypothetical protein